MMLVQAKAFQRQLASIGRPAVVRSFASAAGVAESEKDEESETLSNAFKNQHIRFVPPKKFVFDVNTSEGRMT